MAEDEFATNNIGQSLSQADVRTFWDLRMTHGHVGDM